MHIVQWWYSNQWSEQEVLFYVVQTNLQCNEIKWNATQCNTMGAKCILVCKILSVTLVLQCLDGLCPFLLMNLQNLSRNCKDHNVKSLVPLLVESSGMLVSTLSWLIKITYIATGFWVILEITDNLQFLHWWLFFNAGWKASTYKTTTTKIHIFV